MDSINWIRCIAYSTFKINFFFKFRLEYELLANFLIDKRGYDPSLKQKSFDADVDFVCKVPSEFIYFQLPFES